MEGIARRVMGTGMLALALALGVARPAAAQVRDLMGTGAAFFGAGVSAIGTGELEDRLAARGYPTFGSTPLGVNLGAYRLFPGGLMLGGEWHGLVMGEEEHQGREVGLGGGYGTVGVGYALELSPRARVYPRLGLGAGGMGLWIESEETPVDFDDVLADPESHVGEELGTVVSRGGVVVDLGAGVELLPGGRGRGPLVGLRFGYLAAPFSTDWQVDMGSGDLTAEGGPAATIAGPYVRVVIGGWWRR